MIDNPWLHRKSVSNSTQQHKHFFFLIQKPGGARGPPATILRASSNLTSFVNSKLDTADCILELVWWNSSEIKNICSDKKLEMWKKIIFELLVHFFIFLKIQLRLALSNTLWEFERFLVSQHSINHCRLSTFLEIKQKSASISKKFSQTSKRGCQSDSWATIHWFLADHLALWIRKCHFVENCSNISRIFFQNRFTQKLHFSKIPFLGHKKRVWGRGWKSCIGIPSFYFFVIFKYFLNVLRKKRFFFRDFPDLWRHF